MLHSRQPGSTPDGIDTPRSPAGHTDGVGNQGEKRVAERYPSLWLTIMAALTALAVLAVPGVPTAHADPQASGTATLSITLTATPTASPSPTLTSTATTPTSLPSSHSASVCASSAHPSNTPCA